MRSISMMLYSLGLGLVLLAWCAKTLIAEAVPVCGPLTTAQDILNCAAQNDPHLQQARAEIRTKEMAQGKAEQRPNPSLESRVLFGVADSENDIVSEISLYHPLELGGKRRARIQQAQAETRISQSKALDKKSHVLVKTVIALHRLRQIRSEKAILKENLSTYRRIEGIYQSRPLLSPEQETALTVFHLNSQEAKLEMTSLLDEENHLKLFLNTVVGREVSLNKRLLPSPPKAWPTQDLASSPGIENAAKVKVAQAELQGAKASLRSERSEAWPTLKIGPGLDTDSPLGDTKVAVGFALSTSLPFYQRNEGGKAMAQSEAKAAELNLELTQREARTELERFIEEYQRNVQAMKGAKALGALEKKHHEIEALFERGLIHSTLMLETHRQMFNLKQKYHRNELRAIGALWNIYALEGRILEEQL